MIEPIQSSIAPVGPAAGAGAAAAPARIGAVGETGAADFTALLGQMASDTADKLKAAEAVSISGVQGKASMQQVVEAVLSAEQTLQGAIAIRDKVVAAYLELSRMQI